MKKFVLTLMSALMISVASFAGNEKVSMTEAYSLNTNINSLAEFLELSIDQFDAVEDVNEIFEKELKVAGSENDEAERNNLASTAVSRNLKYMKTILTKTQYSKYLKTLNATLRNRNIKVFE